MGRPKKVVAENATPAPKPKVTVQDSFFTKLNVNVSIKDLGVGALLRYQSENGVALIYAPNSTITDGTFKEVSSEVSRLDLGNGSIIKIEKEGKVALAYTHESF